MEEKNNIDEKWVAYLAGETESTPDLPVSDHREFAAWEEIWDLAGTTHSFRHSDPDQAWKKLNEKIVAKSTVLPHRRFSFLRYAALFLALFALGSITFLLTRNQQMVPNDSVAALPEMKIIRTLSHPATFTTVVLPDGTTVKLNAGTTLQYPEKFTAGSRVVKLSGEGYFDVVHDTMKPFVVEVDNALVEDIGTSFNVSSYPGKKVEVNVTSGSVRITEKISRKEALLAAGSSGKIASANGTISVSNQLSSNYISWMTKQLSFRHTPLSTVLEELENCYHVRLEISDPRIAKISYTANFEKFDLEDILPIIARTHHLTVTKQSNGYVLSSK